MKRIFSTIFFIALVCLFSAEATTFKTLTLDDFKDVHSMGNGRICVYAKSADILQIFGSPYSAPSMLGMFLEGEDVAVQSQRLGKSAIWEHEIIRENESVAMFTDFVATSANSLVRTIKTKEGVSLMVTPCCEANSKYLKFADHVSMKQVQIKGFNEAYRYEIAPGVPFYSRYISPEGYSFVIATKGKAHVTSFDPESLVLKIDVGSGEGNIFIATGDDASKVASTSVRKLKRVCKKNWKKYSIPTSKLDYSSLTPEQAKDLKEEADAIGALLRSQQSAEGGVLAGVVYHMVYVRDHYGVSRAFLALGHAEEARKVLDFYYEIWKKHGYIKNAQAAGWDGIFHCHENDETEITGYLVVQAFDYYRKSGDTEFIKKIMPMLEWAEDAQCRNIVDGMLPFNGDETYIAGGVVPRSVMYHGSAEATLLFIEGSRRLLSFVEDEGIWEDAKIEALKATVDECADRYRDNFFCDGKFYLNNPDRESHCEYPETRPGVCLYPGYLDHYPETFHYKGSLYFCEGCMQRDMTGIEVPEAKRYSIPSAFLFPFYIGAELLTDEEKAVLLEEVIALYKSTGRISSQNKILGYDYGMFLYALVQSGNPLADEIYTKMMDLRDKTGAWVEYYLDGRAFGCPCRPWESGINIEAALEYAKR